MNGSFDPGKKLNKTYSFKQIFKYMSKYKKVQTSENGTWKTATISISF